MLGGNNKPINESMTIYDQLEHKFMFIKVLELVIPS